MASSVVKGRGRAPQRLAALAAVSAVSIGSAVLCGYLLGVETLVRVRPGWPPMAPLGAVELILSGAGLLLVLPGEPRRPRHRAGRAVGALVASTAVGVLLQFATGSRAMDGVLFPDQVRRWAANEVPGRPSLHTAVGFLLVGLTLVAYDTTVARTDPVIRLLVPAALLTAAMVLLGFLYGATYIRHGTATYPGSSPLAGTGLLALGLGAALSRPDRAPGHVFTGRGPGGRALRGLAPSVTAVLLVAVLLTASGRGNSLPVDAGVAVTTATALVITSLYLLFLRTGEAMEAADRKLRDERDYVLTVLDSLREGVITAGPDGGILHVTPRWCEITGYPADEVVGLRPPFPWWPPERVAAMTGMLDAQIGSRTAEETDTQIVRPDGSRVDVLLTMCPVRSRDGAVLRTATYRDLTERKAAEAERRRMADQVDHFFDMSGDLLCIIDRQGYFRRLNPAWEHTLGFSTSELMSGPFMDFVHPEDRKRTVIDAAGPVAAGDRIANFENRYRCRDGSYRWLNWTATLAGDDAVVYGVARDTTDRREAERSQAFLAAIVSSTDDAVIGKTPDGTIVSWNAAAEQMYGYRADEAIGRSMRFLALPGDFDEILAGLRNGEPVVHLESLCRRADGRRLRVSLTISAVRDKDGGIIGAASIARNVTAQVAAEQRFRRLVQAAPDAMIIVDGAGRITLANDQTGRLFGYPSDELIGVPVEQLMPAGGRARHIDHRERFVAAPRKLLMGSGMELYGLRRDGTEFPIEISLAPLETDEGVMIAGAIRDISRRREVEQAMASARDDALAAAKLKSQFVAMVSHEIRTPMNGVIGLTGLLLGTALSAEQARYAEAIRTSGRALLTIINDILDFSKIEAGKISIVAADFDLRELLDTVIEVAAEAGRGKDIAIICYYPPGLPVTVHGDGGRLRQTLLNLVGNAVKFTQRGDVIMRAEPAPAAADGTPRVTFSVADTGVGIAGNDLPRLFEPFTQVDAASNREFGGTGLGLTISHQFVELMGGELTVDSTLGHGSRFTFTIALPGTAAAGQDSLPVFAAQRLLVIDDHPVRRRLVAEHARSWGMTVTGATGQGAAPALLHDAAPDLVVVDDGALAADDRLRAALEASTAPGGCQVIVLVSSSWHTDASTAELPGHRLTKPIGVSRLRDCLQRLCAPDAHGPDHERALARPEQVSGERVRVLLAEDNRINQMVAEDLLDLLGFDWDLAENGTEVVRLAAAHDYRAILMDCQMPKMDGFAATAALRERERHGEHIPIIAMTAGALAEDRKQCLDAGMDDYLTKPIDPEVLRATLERWTRGGPDAAVPLTPGQPRQT